MFLHRVAVAGGIAPLGVAVVLSAGAPSVVRGQARAPVTVNGVAYDSLRGAPLDRARIMIAGTTRSTTSDERGRFRFDSVVPGPHTFVLEHASLDSIGFTEWVARVSVRDGDETVRVTIPSFERLGPRHAGRAGRRRTVE